MVIVNLDHSAEDFILMLLTYKYFCSQEEILYSGKKLYPYFVAINFVVTFMEDFSWEFFLCRAKVLWNLSVSVFYSFNLSIKQY